MFYSLEIFRNWNGIFSRNVKRTMSPTINTIGRFTDAVRQKEKAYNLNCSELETGDDVQ